MGCMVYAVARSKEHLDDDYHPDLDGEFTPNTINSVVFLVGAVQQVSPDGATCRDCIFAVLGLFPLRLFLRVRYHSVRSTVGNSAV